MKKAVLVFAFAILISANAQAFEFHGIKSGMSKEAVSAVLESLVVAQNKRYGYEVAQDELVYDSNGVDNIKSLKGVKHPPLSLSLKYNDKDQLYAMEVVYRIDLSEPDGLGLKLALEHLYKAEVKVTRRFGSLFLVDEQIFNSTIARYKEKYLSEL